ncbi:rhodanese-like domain-containing protein [Candidatus Symbiobacter mobilis]|uniref:Rhodanese domain protein n=1 Tax=Candidatus Symbiobacter mobilis CR TaxID=946483 RepID=U5N632_9BURK|nr:rhodanese-like domain-containing protein [Candidatus Symbiobacter mobilis]AGX86956.1 rhodanese domain protein [Candidatus Symbiobacter mobilis CR]
MDKRGFIKVVSVAMLGAGLWFAAVAPSVAATTPPTLKGVTVVGPAEVKKIQDAGGAIIDTRVTVEFTEKTIKGAKGVFYREKSPKDVNFDASIDSFDLGKLPADKSVPVVFFCNGAECWKSYKAAVLALKAGHTKVYWFRDGLPAWIKAGLPTQ